MNYLFLILVVSLSVINNLHAEEIVISVTQQQSLGITVTKISKNTNLTSSRFPAEIAIPVGQERIVSAAQSGLIDQLYVAAGQDVKKGQPLAHLMSPDLIGLQREYIQALIQSKLATKGLSRDTELFKDGIIPERRLIEMSSTHEEMTASLAQRRQTLKLAGMSDTAINKLTPSSGMNSGVLISASMDGQVLEQMVKIGQRVDMGVPLYRIAKLNPLWLEIHAPIGSFPLVKVGMQVQVPKLQVAGKLVSVIRSINKMDQTILLRAEITKGTENLSPGQFVEAEISSSGEAKYFSVPKIALARKGADSWVFIQSKNGFNPIKVKVISEQSDEAIIDANFDGNERVAISGITAIKGSWLGLGGE